MDTALGIIATLVIGSSIVALYLLPAIIAIFRHEHVSWGSIFVINLLLGWTVIAWIVALAMSIKNRPRVMQVQPPGWIAPRY